ncbi:MAG: division/cell wall cluster transcriptional repressor MraZ [Patescibacteria group bacterium]
MDKSGDKYCEKWITVSVPSSIRISNYYFFLHFAMFIGEYHHALDEKGRLAIPVKFRTAFRGGAVVTRGLDNCLFVYPAKDWKALADRLAKLPISKANTRAFARMMLAGAMDLEIDRQGRVVLPDYLRTFAGLKKMLVVTGLYNRLEIWDETAWEQYRTGTESKSSDIAEALGDLGV